MCEPRMLDALPALDSLPGELTRLPLLPACHCCPPPQDALGGGGAPGGGATETLVINRAPARQGSSLAPRPADSGKPAAGGGDTDTIIIAGGRAAAGAAAAAAPAAAAAAQAAGGQHTAGLTEGLHAANRTSHTFHSGSTVGSDDPTATMRMKTPGAAGLSHRSGGSTGSLGEEATVSLRKPGSGGKGDGGGGGGGAADDTLVINRPSLPKNALGGSSAAAAAAKDGSAAAAVAAGIASASKDHPAPLLKPRRLGVLGKAQRVVPGSSSKPPLAPTAEDGEAAAADDAAADAAAEANRKRKAEAEAAASPNPALLLSGVGEGKRRQSPAADEVRWWLGEACWQGGKALWVTAICRHSRFACLSCATKLLDRARPDCGVHFPRARSRRALPPALLRPQSRQLSASCRLCRALTSSALPASPAGRPQLMWSPQQPLGGSRWRPCLPAGRLRQPLRPRLGRRSPRRQGGSRWCCRRAARPHRARQRRRRQLERRTRRRLW